MAGVLGKFSFAPYTFTYLLLLKQHKKGKSHLNKIPCTVHSTATMAYFFALASETLINWFDFIYPPN